MPLANSCSIRWNRRSEPLRSTRTEMAGYLLSKALATLSATGKSTDVYQTTFPSFCAAAIRAGPAVLAGAATAREMRDIIEETLRATEPARKFLRGNWCCICCESKWANFELVDVSMGLSSDRQRCEILGHGI